MHRTGDGHSSILPGEPEVNFKVQYSQTWLFPGQALRGARVQNDEGVGQVLPDQPRGPAAGQDDRAGAEQVHRPLAQGGRADRADQRETRSSANVLINRSNRTGRTRRL